MLTYYSKHFDVMQIYATSSIIWVAISWK